MDRRTRCLLFRWLHPHHFLILMASCTFTSFILGYAISVSLKNVHYLFPYISDTGTTEPASSYFGLFLNLASVFSAISMYYRHGYLEKQNFLPTVRLHVMNDLVLFLGFVCSFGIMLVANFQETSVLGIHLLGAMFAFVLGIIYCWAHTYFSVLVIRSRPSNVWKIYLRVVLSSLATIGFLLTIIGANVAMKQANTKSIILHWTSDTKGYTAHLVSTFSEWVMGISFIIFFLTFYREFQEMDAEHQLKFSSLQGGIMINSSPQEGQREDGEERDVIA